MIHRYGTIHSMTHHP